jgi:uncharacterized SAM-binding protein YcdF (DUF218 family)
VSAASCSVKPVYVVVPDGLAADVSGATLPAPSFVYKQVLDHVSLIADCGSRIYLAPGNRFGGPLFEHEAGRRYLSAIRTDAGIRTPAFETAAYVDTYGNAAILRDYLCAHRLWPLPPVDLVCAWIHSARAEYCFRKLGYRIRRVHRVAYLPASEEPIVSRLWYYHYRGLHVAYEMLAMLRELAGRASGRKTGRWQLI